MQRQIPEEVLYDERLIERHIKAGLITQQDVTKHRAAAADLSDHVAALDVDSGAKKTK